MISHCFHLVSYCASQLVSVAKTTTMRSNPVPLMKCAFDYTKASNWRYSFVEVKKTRFTSFMPQNPFVSTWCWGCCYMVQHMHTKAAKRANKPSGRHTSLPDLVRWNAISFHCSLTFRNFPKSSNVATVFCRSLCEQKNSVSKETRPAEGTVRPQQKTQILGQKNLSTGFCVWQQYTTSLAIAIFWIQWWHWCWLQYA